MRQNNPKLASSEPALPCLSHSRDINVCGTTSSAKFSPTIMRMSGVLAKLYTTQFHGREET